MRMRSLRNAVGSIAVVVVAVTVLAAVAGAQGGGVDRLYIMD